MDTYDVVVIGGGPGGYVAAIRCAQLGLSTACVDDWSTKAGQPSLGGTCLNVGCIPSKALLESSHQFEDLSHLLPQHGITVENPQIDIAKMQARKESVVSKLTGGIAMLFKKHKIASIHARGRLLKRENDLWVVQLGEQQIAAKNVIVATGSVPRALPFASVDNQKVLDNEGALALPEVPKRLAIIGAGVIGVELGSVWRRLGAQVTILEALPGFLLTADKQVAAEALKQLQGQGLAFHFGVKIGAVDTSGAGVRISYEENGEQKTLEADKLVMAVGRVPTTKGLGAEEVGLKLDERGFVVVDGHLKTNLPNVWAIGDVVRGPALAHKAEEEGIAVAEWIAGKAGHVNYDTIPWVIYTDPEIAWVGKTEEQLKEAGVAFKSGRYFFSANGRALGHTTTPAGFVKLIADAKTDRLLGAHMVGPSVSELIQEVVTVMEFGGSAEDIARTVHGHPTLSEVTMEAARVIAF